MAAGDAEVEWCELQNGVPQLECRAHVVERQVRRLEPFAFEPHARVDDTKLVDVVGPGRQHTPGTFALCRLHVLRRRARARWLA